MTKTVFLIICCIILLILLIIGSIFYIMSMTTNDKTTRDMYTDYALWTAAKIPIIIIFSGFIAYNIIWIN